MSLRTRLLIGYLLFLSALAALGGWSAWRLEEVGAVAHRILSENYESVVAAQNMKESLERQDSAALFALATAHATWPSDSSRSIVDSSTLPSSAPRTTSQSRVSSRSSPRSGEQRDDYYGLSIGS